MSEFRSETRICGQHSTANSGCDADQEERTPVKLEDGALITHLLALYAILLVVLGIAFPITDMVSDVGFYYKLFYLYLCFGSIGFIVYTLAKRTCSTANRAGFVDNIRYTYQHYGTLHLRLGATVFGVGSIVYSILELGQFIELSTNGCEPKFVKSIVPIVKVILILLEITFLFYNKQVIKTRVNREIARFALMHMIVNNLWEWLYVLFEETNHEMIHTGMKNTSMVCEGLAMVKVLDKTKPFLFPCKIEYSLICAVVFFDMWRHVGTLGHEADVNDHGSAVSLRVTVRHDRVYSRRDFRVDCGNAYRGLLAGVLVIVLSIMSMIMFFVFYKIPTAFGGASYSGTELSNIEKATLQVSIVDILLYVITAIAVIVAMVRMRKFEYVRKLEAGIGLDNVLLVFTQTGMYVYCMFSIICCLHGNMTTLKGITLASEICTVVQTTLQTVFILDGWFRRCHSDKRPGREFITFLMIANIAMWAFNTVQKNMAQFRPTHLEFFGRGAWIVITHISMPLAIFYRFHSAICLYEIWKKSYKMKSIEPIETNRPIINQNLLHYRRASTV